MARLSARRKNSDVLLPTSAHLEVAELTAYHKEGGLARYQAAGGLDGLLQGLAVAPDRGVVAAEAAARRARYGENHIPETAAHSYFAFVLDALGDYTIRLLCCCALLSIIIAFVFQSEEELSWLEGVAILGTVIAVCNIQAAEDWSKERSFRKLNAEVQHVLVPVVRDGVKADLNRYDLVVGDIVHFCVGDIIEADGVLVRGDEVECDESALTGEAEDVKKDADTAPFLYSGTAVKNGKGTFVVTAVGINSMSGKIIALVRGIYVAKESEESIEPIEAPPRESLAPLVEDEEAPPMPPLIEMNGDEHAADMEEQSEDMSEVFGEGDNDVSVLRCKLDDMVGRIASFAFASAALASLVMLVRFLYENFIKNGQGWRWSRDPNKILEAIITGIAIIVVAVPEGLPLAVTLAYSLSTRKMLSDNNMVKHLDATETMGSATTICSDKTGTLTQNRMTVVRAYMGGQEFIGEHSNDRTCGKILRLSGAVPEDAQHRIAESVCLNKAESASIRWDKEADRWEQTGNKTDCALLAFADDLEVKYEAVHSNPQYRTLDKNGQVGLGLKTYTFSSSRKRSGQAVPLTLRLDGPCRLYVNGATEIVLKLAKYELRNDGRVVVLTDDIRAQIVTDIVEKFASCSMRTIALAYRDFPSPPDWDEQMDDAESALLTGQTAKTFVAETGLTLLGVLGIHDPVRMGVPAAIWKCNNAGVDVRMCTGDHITTAIAIAKECGILRAGIDYTVDSDDQPLVHRYTAMTGEEFRSKVLYRGGVDLDSFDEVWPHLRVLARSSPEDKHTLVSGLCESDLFMNDHQQFQIFPDRQVVAVTGDGTNDAPALRRADVGFAMKITGTRVAQDAADILLLDDNFESVVKACMWGRNVYDSIAKFLQFQLTVNISAVVFCVLGATTVSRAPLTVVQMLWVNLIMDSLGALALAAEPPTDDLLERAPYGVNKSLLSFEMKCNMYGQSIYQLFVLITIMFTAAGPACPTDKAADDDCPEWKAGGWLNIESGVGRDTHDPPTVHYTLIFNCFVFMQLFNWINCRKLYHECNVFSGIRDNPMFCVIWCICTSVQVILVQAASLGGGGGENKAFKTKALSMSEWAISITCGIFSLAWYWVIALIGGCVKPVFATEEEWKPLGAGSGLPSAAAKPSVPATTIGVGNAPREDTGSNGDEAELEVCKEATPSTGGPAGGTGRRTLRGTSDERLMRVFSSQAPRLRNLPRSKLAHVAPSPKT